MISSKLVNINGIDYNSLIEAKHNKVVEGEDVVHIIIDLTTLAFTFITNYFSINKVENISFS